MFYHMLFNSNLSTWTNFFYLTLVRWNPKSVSAWETIWLIFLIFIFLFGVAKFEFDFSGEKSINFYWKDVTFLTWHAIINLKKMRQKIEICLQYSKLSPYRRNSVISALGIKIWFFAIFPHFLPYQRNLN